MYKNNSIKKYRRLSTSKKTQKGSGLKGAKLGRSIKRTVRRSAERMGMKRKMGSKQAQVEYRKLKKTEGSVYQNAKRKLEAAEATKKTNPDAYVAAALKFKQAKMSLKQEAIKTVGNKKGDKIQKKIDIKTAKSNNIKKRAINAYKKKIAKKIVSSKSSNTRAIELSKSLKGLEGKPDAQLEAIKKSGLFWNSLGNKYRKRTTKKLNKKVENLGEKKEQKEKQVNEASGKYQEPLKKIAETQASDYLKKTYKKGLEQSVDLIAERAKAIQEKVKERAATATVMKLKSEINREEGNLTNNLKVEQERAEKRMTGLSNASGAAEGKAFDLELESVIQIEKKEQNEKDKAAKEIKKRRNAAAAKRIEERNAKARLAELSKKAKDREPAPQPPKARTDKAKGPPLRQGPLKDLNQTNSYV